MDSMTVFDVRNAPKGTLDSLASVPPIPEEYHAWLLSYFEKSQALNNCWQLYQMFCWNYDRYAEQLSCSLDDVVETKAICSGGEERAERIWADANCLASNIISSGRVLTEFMRAFMKENKDDESLKAEDFEERLGNLFDSGGPYALFDKLRNQGQHGQPLVSLSLDEDGYYRAAFDLDQILHPVYYTLKGAQKRVLENLIERLDSVDATHHCLFYGYTIERYVVDILDVVGCFYTFSESFVRKLDDDLREMKDENPTCLGKIGPGQSFIWILIEGVAHLLSGLDEPLLDLHHKRLTKIEAKLDQARQRLAWASQFVKPISQERKRMNGSKSQS